MPRPNTTDEYIASFAPDVQEALQQVRSAIKKAAPDAEEVISYAMPGYKLYGLLVCFGAHAEHIGFYPTPSAIEKFRKEIANYKWAKGSVQFPLNEPLPLSLIQKMVQFRVKENKGNAALKIKAKKKASV